MRSVQDCSQCGGSGQVKTLQEGKSVPQTCGKCGGSGKVVTRQTDNKIRESKYLVE